MKTRNRTILIIISIIIASQLVCVSEISFDHDI